MMDTTHPQGAPVAHAPTTDKAQDAGSSYSTPQIVTIGSDNINISYQDSGPVASGSTLVFLTGLGDSSRVFDDIAPFFFNDIAPFFSDNYRVVAMTRRGYGLSDKPATGYDIDQRTNDVYDWLVKIGVITQGAKSPLYFAGHSIAGGELSHFEKLYPGLVDKYIFIDSAWDYTSKEYTDDLAAYYKWSDDLEKTDPVAKHALDNPPQAYPPDLLTVQTYVDYTVPLAPLSYAINTAVQTAVAEYSQIIDNTNGNLNLDSDGQIVWTSPDSVGNSIWEYAKKYPAQIDWALIKVPVLVLERHYDDYRMAYPWLKLPDNTSDQANIRAQAITSPQIKSALPQKRQAAPSSPGFSAQGNATRMRTSPLGGIPWETVLSEYTSPLEEEEASGESERVGGVSSADLLQIIQQQFALYNKMSDDQMTLFKAACPQAQIAVVPRSTHYIFYEQPITVVTLMQAFLTN